MAWGYKVYGKDTLVRLKVQFTDSWRGQSRTPTRKFKKEISIVAKKLCVPACKFGGVVSTCKQVYKQPHA